MIKIHKLLSALAFLPALLLLSSPVYAATNPPLGTASSFSILSGTYSNTASGTIINGDLGYTTGPGVTPTVNGNTYTGGSTYNQAGIDQGTAQSTLASQPCTFNFAPGNIDLATDITHGPVGVYTPGVYCATGAVSVGSGGITLTGGGTYIFRMDGALTTVANSIVTASGGASACDIWWTPAQATTLGANSTFLGTIIDASGITIGSTVNWSGRALAFGGTVSSSADTINTVPLCSAASAPPTTGGGTTTPKANTPTLTNTGTNLQQIDFVAGSLVVGAFIVMLRRRPAYRLVRK